MILLQNFNEMQSHRYSKLISVIKDGELDISVTWQGNDDTPYSNIITYTEVHWIASPDFPLEHFLAKKIPLPLVIVEPNCLLNPKL